MCNLHTFDVQTDIVKTNIVWGVETNSQNNEAIQSNSQNNEAIQINNNKKKSSDGQSQPNSCQSKN